MSGRDYETLVAEVLTNVGATVQLHVKTPGGEIDVLLPDIGVDGDLQLSVVECKHRSVSQRQVRLGEVVKLFGLVHALKQTVEVRHAAIVTTVGFTYQARRFARLYGIDLLTHDAVRDWFLDREEHADGNRLGLLQVVWADEQGRFQIPHALRQRPAKERDVTVVGMGRHFEVWSPDEWARYVAAASESMIEAGSWLDSLRS